MSEWEEGIGMERKARGYKSNSGFYLPKGCMYLKIMIFFFLLVHLDLSWSIGNTQLTELMFQEEKQCDYWKAF